MVAACMQRCCFGCGASAGCTGGSGGDGDGLCELGPSFLFPPLPPRPQCVESFTPFWGFGEGGEWLFIKASFPAQAQLADATRKAKQAAARAAEQAGKLTTRLAAAEKEAEAAKVRPLWKQTLNNLYPFSGQHLQRRIPFPPPPPPPLLFGGGGGGGGGIFDFSKILLYTVQLLCRCCGC